MSTQAHDSSKAPSNATATPRSSQFETRPFEASVNSAFAPVTNQFQSRPFGVQAKPTASAQETPDTQSQLERAKCFGYDLTSIPVFASSTPSPTSSITQPTVQRKCSACEEEDTKLQRSLELSSTSEEIQRREVCDAKGACWEEDENASYSTSATEELNYTPAPTQELNYTPATSNGTHKPSASEQDQTPASNSTTAVDPAKVTAAADELFKAIDGWGTDEDAILKALAGKTPAEIAAIKKEYAAHYKGRDLEKDLESELSGDDFEEVKAKLSGDQATAAIASLSNSIGVFDDDEAKIEETLAALSPEDLKKMQEMAANNPAVQQKLDKVLDYLGGEDKEVAEALLKGNKEEAAAARIAEAIVGAGTDEKAVYKYLEGKTPEELEKIKAAYSKKTGRSLDVDIADDFSDAEKERADALLIGDKSTAAAAQIKEAAEGLGTDEKGIYDQLKGKSKEERDAIAKAYDAKYGEGSFDAMLKDELSDDDLEQAKQYRDRGQLNPEFALKLAMSGLGTDEDLLKEILKDKTPDQITDIREAYAKETNGGNLDTDLGSEVDGRDAFEIGQMLKGKPQTSKEHYERSLERYEFERGAGSTGFSRTMMDFAQGIGMHSKGEMLEYQTQRLREMFDENGQLKPSFTQQDVEQIAGYQETDTTNYKDAKEAVGKAVTTGGTIAVAALVTVCTKGAAAPWLVAAISGLASGATNMGLRYGMQGSAYGGEDIAIEAVTTALTAAVGGVANKASFLAKIDNIANTFGSDIAKKVAQEAIKGSIQGMSDEAVREIFNDTNWRQGLDRYLLGIGAAGLAGGVKGAAAGGVTGGLDGKSTALVGAASGAAGGLVDETVSAIKGEYKGRLEDLLGRLAIASAHEAGAKKVESAASEIRLKWIASQVVSAAVANDMTKANKIIDTQTAHLSPDEKETLRQMILTQALSSSLEPEYSSSPKPPVLDETTTTEPSVAEKTQSTKPVSNEITPDGGSTHADELEVELGIVAKQPTADGAHEIKITESGRVVRCSKCDDLISHLQDNYEHVFIGRDDLVEQLDEIQKLAKDPTRADEALEKATQLEAEVRHLDIQGVRAEAERAWNIDIESQLSAEESSHAIGTREEATFAPGNPPHSPKGTDLEEGDSWETAKGGMWGGKESIDASRANAQYYSDDPRVNAITQGEPIEFRNGEPDFSPWAQETVNLQGGMTGDNNKDFPPCDLELALRRGWLKANGEPNKSAAEAYRKENRLTWHHVPGEKGTMILVPRDLHANVPHAGGASWARNQQ